jgi:hypothetical protein
MEHAPSVAAPIGRICDKCGLAMTFLQVQSPVSKNVKLKLPVVAMT